MIHRIAVTTAVSVGMLAVGRVAAQNVGLGLSAAWMATAGTNVEDDCSVRDYRGGIGPSLSIRGQRLSVSVTARRHLVPDGSSCTADQVPPPANGTVEQVNRYPLLSTRFLTTDARVDLRPARRLGLGLGGGVAWHEGVDFPYALLAGEFLAIAKESTELAFGVELYALRVTTDRTQLTYQNSQLVATTPLPREKDLSHALQITATWRFLR